MTVLWVEDVTVTRAAKPPLPMPPRRRAHEVLREQFMKAIKPEVKVKGMEPR